MATRSPSIRPYLSARVIAPIVIAAASLAHPPFGALLSQSLSRIQDHPWWLPLHAVLLAGVVGLDVALLAWRPPGLDRRLSALVVAASATNAVLYSTFVGIDGFAGGILAQAPHLSHGAALDAVTTLFASPLVDWIGWAGGIAWVVAALTIVASRWTLALKSGPGVLLVVGTVWLAGSHAPPFGVVGGCACAGAGVWSVWVDNRPGGR